MIKRWRWPLALLLLAAALVATFFFIDVEYTYLPPLEKVINPVRGNQAQAYDWWGRALTHQEAAELQAIDEEEIQLAPSQGAVPIDAELLELGREVFYKETFGNEYFLSDVMGILHGPLKPWNVAQALIALRGAGTTNLQVVLAEDFMVNGRTYAKGSLMDTGLDVPQGAFAPLGMPMRLAGGRIHAGIACAACHSTVDPESGLVLEGVTNPDINTGLMMAMASNSAAYFTHAEVPSLTPFVKDRTRTVTTRTGEQAPLPNPAALEAAVDAIFAAWPPGNFDSTTDLRADPTQIPDSFTLGDHPYGWSGFALAGPFRGLTVLNNNVHGQNSDSLTQTEASPALFDLDQELYVATILQNAANPRFRYDPASGQAPTDFFAQVDPTPGVVGINELVPPPTFPKISLVAPDGLLLSSPGYPVWQQTNALSAWQNTLMPPLPALEVASAELAAGRTIFERAGCNECHTGPALTNNQILPAPTVGTEPTRAQAFAKSERFFAPPVLYGFDTPVPLPSAAQPLAVPTDGIDPAQAALALAHDTPGGYKVPSLIGLYWSAPYLHDGGVAVGIDATTQLGIPGTHYQQIPADPANSLRALVDAALRQQVVAANEGDPILQKVRVTGRGHEFWVDEASGFNAAEQQLLINYLLGISGGEEQAHVQTPRPVDNSPIHAALSK